MRILDMQTWSRLEHFRLFNAFDHPYFGICTNVDLTAFYPAVKQCGVSFTVAVVYLIARAANAIPEFRLRIRGEQVVEHEVVHPSATILIKDDLFSFCYFDYVESFREFAAGAAKRLAQVRQHPTVENERGDHFLFMSPIPWVSFTSFMHPIHLSPPDSIPRFAWGKYFKEAGALKMPLQAQAHHALMDGVHMAKFYANVQDLLSNPSFVE